MKYRDTWELETPMTLEDEVRHAIRSGTLSNREYIQLFRAYAEITIRIFYDRLDALRKTSLEHKPENELGKL